MKWWSKARPQDFETNMTKILNKHKQTGAPLKRKVFVAMSGGVDSAVAALLLLKQGYDVTGAFMVNYEGKNALGETCWVPDYHEATRVAAKLGIPLMRLDFKKEYRRDVLEYVKHEYVAGRTPNPDVMCNRFVKFGAWLNKAKALGFDFLATGHYAKVKAVKGKYLLLEAKDKNKDQTYFLHQLDQKQLSYTLFPLGDLTKAEVRKLAKKNKLPNAEREESMGICFVGEVSMKDFLQNELKIKARPGKIILGSGEVVGQHTGLPFYTMGQREQLGISLEGKKKLGNQALYVVDKIIKKNELVVGGEDDPRLFKEAANVAEINWITGQEPVLPLKCEVRLRHRQTLHKCTVRASDRRGYIIKFTEPERAVTPGQFAVFYKKGVCLGGGVIQ